ncbi:hypothetical protein Tco_0443554, partial [Tanacetum coccineum]
KFVKSGCTTALNVLPWETEGESVIREAYPTRASFHDLLLLSLFIAHSVCLLLLPYSVCKFVRPGCTTDLNVVPWETDGESVLREVIMTIDTNVTAPVNVTGAPVINTVANHPEKPKKFNGHNFKRWQQKMFFYLTTLNLARFLNETAPQVEPPKEGQPSNAQAVQAMEAWKH